MGKAIQAEVLKWFVGGWEKMIEEQPTACDVDKVVEKYLIITI